MSDSLNNKELVAVGHQFAKAMSSETPILDIAKIVSRLAERLDCTTAALHATQAQRDQLATENAALKDSVTYFAYSPEYGFDYFESKQAAIDTAQEEIDAYREDADDGWSEDVQRVSWGIVIQQAQGFDAQGMHTSDKQHTYQTCDYRLVDAVETPATDAFLAEVQAKARNELVDELEARFTELTKTLPAELQGGAAGAAGLVSTFRQETVEKQYAELEAQTALQLPQPVQVSVDFTLIRRALANAGISAPESDEELGSSHIRQILKFVAEQEA